MKAVISLRVLTAAAVVMAGASIVLGVGITPIGVLNPGAGTIDSRVYAISPDGTYAVGSSNGQNVAQTSTLTQAVIWSATSGLVQLPNAPALPMAEMATSARGVVVKANGDIGVAAYSSNYPTTSDYRMAHYTATPGALGAGTYVISAGTSNLRIGEYNAARNYDDGTGGTLSNNWTISGQRSNGGRAIMSGSWGSYGDSGALAGYGLRVYNVTSRVPSGSGRGFSAGYDRNNTTLLKRATFGIVGSLQFLIPGTANSITGQSESLGMSPYTTVTSGSGVIVGYDADPDGTTRAFAYNMAGYAGSTLNGTRTLLDEWGDGHQSQAIDVRVVGGHSIIGGFISDGYTESAVLWDGTGMWTGYETSKARSVMELLNGAGLDTSAWARLSRVTSMSDDGRTVGGWGVWAEDGSTRGFIATIPEPASLLLLTLGGLALLRRNRR